MKKGIALLLVAALLMVGLTGCFSQKAAYDASKEAFAKTTEAYLLVNEYSQDIYEAWRLGVSSDKTDYNSDGELKDFANEMHVDLESIQKAIASLLKKDAYATGDWETLQYFYDSFFSACVSVISEAYIVNGTADEIEEMLVSAKSEMKTLGDKYSDYTYYPALKAYFTNTLAFFDFCKNPEGSFEQVKDTFNNYRNNARTYFFELNYVFEDSIGGMHEAAEEETTAPTENAI